MPLLFVVRFCSVRYKINIVNSVQLMGEPFKVSAWCKTRAYRSAHSYAKRGYGKKGAKRVKRGDFSGKGICGVCLGGRCAERE